MRGTLNFTPEQVAKMRITPAHAGNTAQMKAKLANDRDHPRPCGEHMASFGGSTDSLGSPPPMRGTLGLSIGTLFN